MYKCYECGLEFDEPKIYSEDCTPGESFEKGSFCCKYRGCPRCGENFGELIECDACGDQIFIEDSFCTSKGRVCSLCEEESDEDGE